MRKWLILLSALSMTSANGAPAWRWVDASGQVHFSDRPVPGATQIELGAAQGFGRATAERPTRVAAATGEPGATPANVAAAPYQAVEVVSPAEQETLRNIGSVLNVQVRFQPNLQPGHRYDLVFDGQRQNLNTGAGRATVNDVFRGTHTLQVVVIDSAGIEVQRSPVRNFIVMATSVLNPNNPVNRAPSRP
jgi:hypothetical protein